MSSNPENISFISPSELGTRIDLLEDEITSSQEYANTIEDLNYTDTNIGNIKNDINILNNRKKELNIINSYLKKLKSKKINNYNNKNSGIIDEIENF